MEKAARVEREKTLKIIEAVEKGCRQLQSQCLESEEGGTKKKASSASARVGEGEIRKTVQADLDRVATEALRKKVFSCLGKRSGENSALQLWRCAHIDVCRCGECRGESGHAIEGDG